MLVVGRVVGAAVEEPWTDKEGRERISRKLTVVDEGLKSVVEIAFREQDWTDAALLDDNDPVTIEVSSLSADRFGRVKMYGRVRAA